MSIEMICLIRLIFLNRNRLIPSIKINYLPESFVTLRDWVRTLYGMFTPDLPPVPHCPNCSLTDGRTPKIGASPLTIKSGRFTPDRSCPPLDPDENGYR